MKMRLVSIAHRQVAAIRPESEMTIVCVDFLKGAGIVIEAVKFRVRCVPHIQMHAYCVRVVLCFVERDMILKIVRFIANGTPIQTIKCVPIQGQKVQWLIFSVRSNHTPSALFCSQRNTAHIHTIQRVATRRDPSH